MMFKEIADIFKEKLATEYDEKDRHSIELITEGINQFFMGEKKEEEKVDEEEEKGRETSLVFEKLFR